MAGRNQPIFVPERRLSHPTRFGSEWVFVIFVLSPPCLRTVVAGRGQYPPPKPSPTCRAITTWRRVHRPRGTETKAPTASFFIYILRFSANIDSFLDVRIEGLRAG